jgi:hypothetical protein
MRRSGIDQGCFAFLERKTNRIHVPDVISWLPENHRPAGQLVTGHNSTFA